MSGTALPLPIGEHVLGGRPVLLGGVTRRSLLGALVVLGGIIGGIVGFLIGLLFTEAIIGNPANGKGFDWQGLTDVLLTIIGVLIGVAVARRLKHTNAKSMPNSPQG